MSSDGRKSTLYELRNYIANISAQSETKTPATWWLSNEIKVNGIEKAVQKYKIIMKENDKLISNEQTLNSLAYSLLADKKLDDGSLLMKLNLEYYPESANAHDSYAELLIETRHFEKAAAVVKRGLLLAEQSKNDMLIKILKDKQKVLEGKK